jgi:hypothetical protein
MNGVYLSLNQGWTQYEKKFGNNQPLARKAIIKKTKELQSVLESSYDFPKAPIDLHAKNNLGRGYELGHICGKYYPKESLPDDIHLIDDLRNLVGVYRELKGKTNRKPILDFEIEDYEAFDTPFSPEIKIQELILDVVISSERPSRRSERPILFDLEKNLLGQKSVYTCPNHKSPSSQHNQPAQQKRHKLHLLSVFQSNHVVKLAYGFFDYNKPNYPLKL